MLITRSILFNFIVTKSTLSFVQRQPLVKKEASEIKISCPRVNMVTRRFATEVVTSIIYDNNFGVSDSGTSTEENGEEDYAHISELVMDRQRLVKN